MCGEENCPGCCFHCKERGHIKARCPRKRAGPREEPAVALPPLMATTGPVPAGAGPEAGRASDLLWCADGGVFSLCGEPGAAQSVHESTRSERAAALTAARFTLFPVHSKRSLGIINIPTLCDTGFLNRSSCSGIMCLQLFNCFFRK